MNELDERLMTSIREEFSKIPEANQRGINAYNWLKKCQVIGERFLLSDEEILGLKTEVALVLMGLEDFHTLHRYIDLEIGGTGWEEIETYLIDNVFNPTGDIIDILVKNDAT